MFWEKSALDVYWFQVYSAAAACASSLLVIDSKTSATELGQCVARRSAVCWVTRVTSAAAFPGKTKFLCNWSSPRRSPQRSTFRKSPDLELKRSLISTKPVAVQAFE